MCCVQPALTRRSVRIFERLLNQCYVMVAINLVDGFCMTAMLNGLELLTVNSHRQWRILIFVLFDLENLHILTLFEVLDASIHYSTTYLCHHCVQY